MEMNYRQVYVKDLAKIQWQTSPGRVVWRVKLSNNSSSDRIAWSFDFADLHKYFAEYDYNSCVVCGIRIRPEILTAPPGDEPSHIYSVFLRKNGLSFMGIPGDFSMLRENEWTSFSYPLPIYFLNKMRPVVFIERDMTSIEKRQMQPRPEPIVEIILHRVEDISVGNYVFVMMDSFKNKIIIRNIFMNGTLTSPTYFQGTIPGPLKVIPSWGIIHNGWLGSECHHRSEKLSVIEYLANYGWTVSSEVPESETDLHEAN